MPIIESSYTPARWLSNPHLQTILASQLFRPPAIETDQERVELADGDFIDINLSRRQQGDIVAIFHGLAGSINSNYIRGVWLALEAAGFRPALMHWRGCSGEPNRLPRAYHSGASDDIQWFIDLLHQRQPQVPIHALGYSLGGNALLKYLGESGSDTPLQGAMAVSPPLVLKEGAEQLDTGVSRLYQRHLLRLMRRHHECKRERYPQLNLPAATRRLDSLRKFDDALTAPLHGFADAAEYYERCSARQFLPRIRVPTHILCAYDDPFFTPRILPEASELASGTCLEVPRSGGHVGFLQGRKRWLDTYISQVLSGFRQGVQASARH